MELLPSAGFSDEEKPAGKLLVLVPLVRWESCSALLESRKPAQHLQPRMKTVALQRSIIFNFSLLFPLSKPESDNDWVFSSLGFFLPMFFQSSRHAAVRTGVNEVCAVG